MLRGFKVELELYVPSINPATSTGFEHGWGPRVGIKR